MILFARRNYGRICPADNGSRPGRGVRRGSTVLMNQHLPSPGRTDGPAA